MQKIDDHFSCSKVRIFGDVDNPERHIMNSNARLVCHSFYEERWNENDRKFCNYI